VPALAAGLDALAERGKGGAPAVLALAADLPFLTPAAVDALAAGLTGAYDGALLVDRTGRDQPLAAAYRTEPLRRELALLRSEHGTLAGLPLRLLAAELTLRRIPDPTGEAGFDCDTWEDVAVARARLGGSGGGKGGRHG
jgi:molybdopterin-guanine dinucleotide biosynthesis protein A